MSRRILVCGGRDYADAAYLNAKLDKAHGHQPFDVVIHGAYRGARGYPLSTSKRIGG